MEQDKTKFGKVLTKKDFGSARAKAVEKYFLSLENQLKKALEHANKARAKGYDPTTEVEIPIAKDMSERIEGLIAVTNPELVGKGIPARIKELENKYGLLDWRVALKIAEEVAKQKFVRFNSIKEAIEAGARVGFLYITLGIVSSPLEGFVGIEFKKRSDGKDYVAIKYAGPVRAAGGTAAAFSVIIVDYVRRCLGIQDYDPREEEIMRSVIEIYDYHDKITNLQYLPQEEEIIFMLKHIKVQIDGEPTEEKEVTSLKDLERIGTRRIRGGLCLVVGEGLCQKARKLYKKLKKFAKDFGLEDWLFLKEFIEIQERIKAKPALNQQNSSTGQDSSTQSQQTKLLPNYSYLKDIVAGRPILSHPSKRGGFNLRYGRTRVSGYVSYGFHPSVLYALNNSIAIGTQLKPERPTKGCTVVLCDSIEPPIVRLKGGDVIKLRNPKQAKKYAEQDMIDKILFLGNVLIDYGDFYEFGHELVPGAYCEEWWALELEKAIIESFGSYDINKASYITGIDTITLKKFIEDPLTFKPNVVQAYLISKSLGVPLHPEYIFYWKDLNEQDLLYLLNKLDDANIYSTKITKINEESIGNSKEYDKIEAIEADIESIENQPATESNLRNDLELKIGDIKVISKIVMEFDDHLKQILEFIGVEHKCLEKDYIIIEKPVSTALAFNLGLHRKDVKSLIKELQGLISNKTASYDIFSFLNILSGLVIRDKAGTFIGMRMGRPEKAKQRELTGSPQVLFPIGEQGGRMRSFQSAIDHGFVIADFPVFYCKACDNLTIFPWCEKCGNRTEQKYYCNVCHKVVDKDHVHKHSLKPYYTKKIDIRYYFDKAISNLGLAKTEIPKLIKGVRGTTNKTHIPEPIEKGILRAIHRLYVNKDGTIRYDLTELPITHFKPKEIGTSVEKLRQLGYEYDIYGEPLTNEDQVLELFPQDIILPGRSSLYESAADIFFRIANFVDDLLVRFYKVEPFYNLKSKQDLVGHLVLGLAPHISAATIGRIIGFSDVQALLAHPLWHAALRRDCDGDEAACMLLMDPLLNFSKHFLPSSRGSTQDTPLVLTIRLVPSEVDDQSHGLSVVTRYPLELYEAALQYKNPWEVNVEQIRDRVGTSKEYYPIGFTHPLSNFNSGVIVSAYKSLPTMEEKLNNQMKLAEIIQSVDENDVARLVIEKHFIKDLKGNLRKFSMQQFRCSSCNTKYRRPPIIGKCPKCGGKIIFTISEGSIKKYLDLSLRISQKYDVPIYLKNNLELVRRDIDSIFGVEKEKQSDLGSFFVS